MKGPKENEILSKPAARLAHAAPAEWKEFLTAYRAYAESIRDRMLRAPVTELQTSQGWAQHASELNLLLDDAVKAADVMTQRASLQRAGR